MSTDLETSSELDREPGSVWDYISPSRLNLFLRCPLAWKLRYIDGIRTPTSPSLLVGKMVHVGLEVHYRHRQLGMTLDTSDVVGRMLDGWDAAVVDDGMTFTDIDQEMMLRKQAVDLVVAYLAHVSRFEPRPLAVELTMQAPLIDPVTGEDLGIPMLGVVDLIEADEDGAVIVDFKTASKSSPPFEVTHEIQLSCYAYLFRQVEGQREGGLEIRSLIKTKQPKVEQHRYETRQERHFRRLFAVIREYLDTIDRGRFSYRPGWGCGMCDFRDTHCAAWEA